MCSINFTAKFITNVPVQKRLYNNQYREEDVAVVELDKNDEDDMNSLRNTASNWLQRGGYFAFCIYNDAVKEWEFPHVKKEHYLAITTQDSHYDKLKPDNILGLSLFSETELPENHLDWLEVKPSVSKSRSKNRQYKLVGTSMLSYISQAYPNKNILVTSAPDVVEFYKKNGYKQKDKTNTDILVYNV